MPLFDTGAYLQPNSRSHTNLVISGGNAPAERWIADPTLPSLFEYSYGGPGDVVIPKGVAVALAGMVDDWDTGRKVAALTIADPANGRYPIGIAEYNVYARVNDRLKGNQPNVITRDYIELPYIPNADDAALIKWGAVFGSADAIIPGAYLKATSDPNNLGKLEPWDSAQDSVIDIVGQILGMEVDLPPVGWLKWVTPEIDNPRSERAPDTNTSGQTPSYNYKDDSGGYQVSPDYKWPLTPDYRAETIDWMKTYAGIPGLTDGGMMAIRYARVAIAGAGNNVINLPDGPNGAVQSVDEVRINGTVATLADDNNIANIEAGKYVYDLANKQVTVNVAGGESIVVKYVTKKVIGIMPGWDFAGSTGAVRLLLKF